MRRSTLYLLGLCVVLSTLLPACTGVMFVPGQTNTNPAQEYARSEAFYKGGCVQHHSLVGGSTGNARNLKMGRSCARSALWIVAWGNAGINAARKQGGIQKIALVEYEINAFGGFVFHEFCTIVHGE